MPKHPHPDFNTKLADEALTLSDRWMKVNDMAIPMSTFTQADIKEWITGQTNIFLDKLLVHVTETPFTDSKLTQMDGIYNFSKSNNSEIKFRWQMICLKCGVSWIVPQVVEFIKSQGRMKYVRPLYRTLNACSAVNGTQVAKTTFIQYNSM